MSTPQFPHAALLIDFDNVTMGIRSDLSKELKNLLSSDFIKGKVAVQRAYADWRRYPQYIVPLAESSVDLIFAPAYGSSKKNATDIRLAIDALELVFTRPEIGTFILLSGDSDFSSLVLKLKEYGKYVVGVGIRESASDLLVQNCDEYYSYSALTGLTRAGEESATTAEDPWELVELAIKQMAENDDVMRSDRLKQVILEMDPTFDEKALGFQKFNRFMQEAASRGLVSLRKLENGQFEVGLPGTLDEPLPLDEEGPPQQGNGRRRSRRGRGRDRDRDSTRERERPADEVKPAAIAEAAAAEAAAPLLPEAVAEPEPAAVAAVAPPMEERAEAEASLARPKGATREDPLRSAYGLLRRAVAEVVGRSGEAARDSDIKRRMLELEDGWDEATLGFSKFSRFLRQAHDADVINLRKLDNGGYEAALAAGGEHVRPEPAPERPQARGRRERGRTSRSGGAAEAASAAAAGVAEVQPSPAGASESERASAAKQAPTPSAPAEKGQVATQVSTPPASAAKVKPTVKAPAATTPVAQPLSAAAPSRAAAAPAAPIAAPAGLGIGMRRGSRGRMPGAAPPPLLEGQTIPRVTVAVPTPAVPTETRDKHTPGPEAQAAAPAAALEQPEKVERKRGGRRGRGRADAAAVAAELPAPAQPQEVAAPAQDQVALPAADGQRPAAGRGGVRKAAAAKAEPVAEPRQSEPAVPDIETLGLPADREGVVAYLREYEGVGPKSVQSLVDAFGPTGVFRALRDEPDRVRAVVGGTRGERLLEAWHRDYQRRVRAQARKQAGRGGRGRRGGRGSKRTTRAS